MYVYYYQIEDTTYFTVCRGVVPGRLSPVWDIASSAAWLIPGTYRDDEDYE